MTKQEKDITFIYHYYRVLDLEFDPLSKNAPDGHRLWTHTLRNDCRYYSFKGYFIIPNIPWCIRWTEAGLL